VTDTLTETCKIALFGANQSGKTLQIGSLIRKFGAANVGIVSCEDGLKTVASVINPEHVKECNGLNDLRAAYRWAAERYAGPEKWVCVDGGTRAMQWIAGDVWAGADACFTRLALSESKAQFLSELPRELKPYMRFITSSGEIDGQRQWIQIGRDIDFEINRWVKMPANMFWTFWEDQTSLDQYRKGLPWQVDCPGKAGRDAVYGSFDIILRLTREGEKVVATHDPTRRVVRSKTRDDWQGGIKVPTEMVGFNLAGFVTEVLKPQTIKETR
jgi:hypothetical protein